MAGREADVCLVVEGSYPFVRGGVSAWCQALIRGLPELAFHVWCLVPRTEGNERRYELPENVVGLTVVPLFDRAREPARALDPGFWPAVRALAGGGSSPAEQRARFWELADRIEPGHAIDAGLLVSDPAFEILTRVYDERHAALSFLDYVYTIAFLHAPLLKVLAASPPPARVFHAVSTGYAGALGARAARMTRRPLMLTEHGLYTHERRLEILDAEWLREAPRARISLEPDPSGFQQVWQSLFELLGRLTYAECSRVYALFGANARAQIALGADAERLEVIPNGVVLSRFDAIVRTAPGTRAPLVALVGRVVKIKDVRTFVRAVRVVADRFPDLRAIVIGPGEEEPEYLASCLEQRTLLGLEDCLTFAGHLEMDESYAEMDVLALTSVSEGLPLVVLEAMACGIPCVCTRVGACEELLLGADDADRARGPAGRVLEVGDHEGIAAAIVELLEDRELAAAMGRVGRARVRARYDQDRVIERYRDAYARQFAALEVAPASRKAR